MTPQSFRTANDEQRLKSANDVVAKYLDRVDAAKAAAARDEAACTEDPSEKNMAKAKASRHAVEDAERDLELAQRHASTASAEVAAAELQSITAEIALRESTRELFIDDEARAAAVEIGTLSASLHDRLMARETAMRAEHEELQALRRRVGLPTEPWQSPWANEPLKELVRLSWAAQGDSSIERGGGHFAPPELVLDLIRSSSRVTAVQQYGEEAKALAQRVAARRSTSDKGKSLAKAAVGTLAAIAALTVSGG